MVTFRIIRLVAAAAFLLANSQVFAQTAPMVALTATCTAPCNQTATVTLTATATAASGRQISKVEFYDGATLLVADTTSPYSSTRTGVTGGSHSFTAKAYDNGTPQLNTVSAAKVVAVNAPPAVSLVATCSASPCVAGSTVSLTAAPTDADGSITKVEFYQGATLLATRNVAPWIATSAALAVGSYSFTAKAFDNGTTALSATSSTQAVAVTAPPPTVSITANCTAPCNQAATVALTANAAAANGRSIAKVEFYDGAILLGSVTTSPYSLSRIGVAGGTHNYTARAYDNSTPQLSTTSANQAVAVNTPPTVSVVASCAPPCTAPATVTLSATAADVDGAVSKVEFYRGATLLGTRNAAPWTLVESTAPAGSNSYTAKAYDNAATPLGTTSAARSVTVGAATTTLVPIAIDGPQVNLSLPGTLPPTLTFSAQAGDMLSLRIVTNGLYENLMGSVLPLGAAKHIANFTGADDSSAILFDAQYPQYYYENGTAKEVVSLREGFLSLLVRQTGTYSLKLVDYGTAQQAVGFQLLRATEAATVSPNASFDTDTQRSGQPILYRLVVSALGSHFAITLRNRLDWMDGSTPRALRVRVFRPDSTLLAENSAGGGFLFAGSTSNGDQHFTFELPVPVPTGEYRMLVTPLLAVAGGTTAFVRTGAPGGTIVPNGPEVVWTPAQSPVDGVSYQFPAESGVEYTLVARTTEMPAQYRHPSAQAQTSSTTYHINIDCCAGVATPLVGTTKFTLNSSGPARISVLEPQDVALAPSIRFSLLSGFTPSVSLAATNTTTLRRDAPYFYEVVTGGLGTMAVDRVAVYAYLTGEYKYDRFEIGSCPPAAADHCSLIWNAFAEMRPSVADPRPRSIYPVIHFANGLSLEGGIVHLQNVNGPGLVLDSAGLHDGMLVADDQVSFRGSVTGPKNISVFVNDVRVPTRPGGEFVANNIALPPGQSTITILAATLHETRTYTVNVTRNGEAPFAVEALYDGGLSPLSTRINVHNRAALPWVRVGIDIDGDGIDDQTVESVASGRVALPFTLISRAAVRVTVYGAGNTILYRTVRYLLPQSEQDATAAATEVHADLATDLEAFSSERSYEAFTFAGLTKFKPIIQAFGGGLANASMWLGTVDETTLAGSRCELKVRRFSNGNWKVFRIQMLRDAYDGLWRVADM